MLAKLADAMMFRRLQNWRNQVSKKMKKWRNALVTMNTLQSHIHINRISIRLTIESKKQEKMSMIQEGGLRGRYYNIARNKCLV